MARSLNRVYLLGYLGADPEVQHTPSGLAVARVSLATSESWADGDGNRQERTEWHRLVLWRKLAEVAGQYLHKGSRVMAEGKLQTRQWEQEGQKRYQTEVVVSDLTMLDGRNEGRQEGAGSGEPAGIEDDGLPF